MVLEKWRIVGRQTKECLLLNVEVAWIRGSVGQRYFESATTMFEVLVLKTPALKYELKIKIQIQIKC
jgi:hypothetical protein